MPSSILSRADIVEFRELVRLGMFDTCKVESVSVTDDAYGGSTSTDAITALVDCQLEERDLRPEERLIADRLGWSVAYAITLPYATVVTPHDRLIVNGERAFEVGGVAKGGASGIDQTAICQEVG